MEAFKVCTGIIHIPHLFFSHYPNRNKAVQDIGNWAECHLNAKEPLKIFAIFIAVALFFLPPQKNKVY